MDYSNFTALDFETANSSSSSVCAVGIVVVEEGQITKRITCLVNPAERFSSFNISIHGIRPSDVAGEPEFPEVWEKIRPYLENRLIIAHNASFDIGVLQAALRKYCLDIPDFKSDCSVKIARRTWHGLENYKLNTVASYLGITFQHHDAGEDALTCAKIVLAAGKK